MIKRRILYIIIVILGALGSYTYLSVFPKLSVLNAYAAKKACSCHFIADRSLESIVNEDLSSSLLGLASVSIDENERSATSSVWGLGKTTAYFHESQGCILRKQKKSKPGTYRIQRNNNIDSLSWPYSDIVIPVKRSGFKATKIREADSIAFDAEGKFEKKTRALLIMHNDSLLLERYADGFDKDTEILGWSMSKSIANILIGILVKDSILQLDQDSLFREWTDERSQITLEDLLRMRSGLKWVEDYSSVSNATKMLFLNESATNTALNCELEFEPGIYFEYSSGTTNLLSLLIRNQFATHQEYLEFPYRSLFGILNANSMFIETDPSDHYVMSSYSYGTPRDWAKLAYLYLKKGSWAHDTIFSEDYYRFSIRPGITSESRTYGAHIWLNTDKALFSDAPQDMFFFSGYEGQYACVFPSHDMIIVRMGLNDGPPFDMNAVILSALEAIE